MPAKKTQQRRMTQSQIIKHFAERFNVKPAKAKELFTSLSDMASTQIKETGEFQLPGFGKLVAQRRPPRVGRNPLTGETIQIKAKTVVKFRVSNSVKMAALPGKSTKKIPPRGK